MQYGLDVAWFMYLLAVSIGDIKHMSISKSSLIFGGLLTAVSIYIEGWNMGSLIIGGVLGVSFLLVSKYTKEALGYGDSIMIALISLRLGGYVAIYTLGGAFAMVALYGVIRKWRKGQSKEVPFLPFLTVACTGSMILW